MIKGVIFDLDGVLVSTDELHFKAWKKLAEELGVLPQSQNRILRYFILLRENYSCLRRNAWWWRIPGQEFRQQSLRR